MFNNIVHITENKELAKGIFRLVLNAPQIAADAIPGQFVNLYLNDAPLLLPRPLSIADVENGNIHLVYAVVGAGTAQLSRYAAGDSLRVLGPQGNGYDLSGAGRAALLIGGGLGVPPLLYALRKLSALRDMTVTVLLGYRDEAFLAEEFMHIEQNGDAKIRVYRISEQYVAAGRKYGQGGNVMELLAHLIAGGKIPLADLTLFSCGPKPMLRAVSEWANARGIPAQLSLEERMGCGYGACVGCTLRVRGRDGKELRKKVCVDGPVFEGREIIWESI